MINPSTQPLSEADQLSLRELIRSPEFLLLQSLLNANETVLCHEAAADIMDAHKHLLSTGQLQALQLNRLCDASRFRITSEVLGEIVRGDKTVRAVKPKE